MPKPQRDRSTSHQRVLPGPPAELIGIRTEPARTAGAGKAVPGRRPTYPEAVARFESGVVALQEHRFGDAADAFRTVLLQYPDEKELNDRARLYLAVCDRHLRSAPQPSTPEERLYAATLALNAGDRPTAMSHLRAVVEQDPRHDGALYMLAVAHALIDDRDQALVYLLQAIAQNPDNRALALQDGDLERLMQDEAVRAAVHSAPVRQHDGRTTSRHRPIR